MPLPLVFMICENDAQANALEERGAFTTMTEGGPRQWPLRSVVLLIDARQHSVPEFIGFGIGTRSMQRVATGWHRLAYQHHASLAPPLDIAGFLDALPGRFRRGVDDRMTWGGALTPQGAASVLEALRQNQPRTHDAILSLRGQPQRFRRRLTAAALQAAAQEADAARLAMDLSGFPRSNLRDARPDGQRSFVGVLSSVRGAEDNAIAYDSMRFLDFDRIDHPSGLVTFEKGNELLTILNVNRRGLEKTTGADLIYVNERTHSFVLVQYKAFRREKTRAGPTRLVYRPDRQFREELGRLRTIRVGKGNGSTRDFRLHPGCAFLKICKPVIRLDHDPRELVSGMYLPLDYYDTLVASGDVRGPKGGIAVAYDNVPRHVNNDLFVSLVQGGWIGSRSVTSERLTSLVLAGLEAGTSVTVATTSSLDGER